MPWKTLDDIALAGRTVLVRVDLNVPLRDGQVSDATRIERIVPTVDDIVARGGKPVLLSHFDRPRGRVVPAMSLAQIVPALKSALGRKVHFAADCVGTPAESAIAATGPGEVALLENTRFHPGEEANDPALAARMAALGDVYVNDAFSAAHRAHASTEAIARLLPRAAGRLMEAELRALDAALGRPARPLMAVVGGAKVSTKLALLENLVGRVDHLAIGGGMANTFLLAQGLAIGTSLAERDMAATAQAILARAQEAGCRIHLPRDVVVAERLAEGVPSRVVMADECPADAMILDTGPEAVAALKSVMAECATLIWNGPLGAFEVAPFDAATTRLAREAARLTRAGRLVSVAGGGDTVAALNHAGVAGDFTFISTAGGAFLEWMEGRELPGVVALLA